MSVVVDDEIIDQTDYEEFEGVADRDVNKPEPETPEQPTKPTQPISPDWQLSNEHTFVQEHFCKVTSCEYCGHVIASLRWHQGLRCKECSFDCHYDCAAASPKNCLPLHNDNPLRPDVLQPHNFYEKHFAVATFCNVCRKMLYGLGKQGFACATCQFVSHQDCMGKAATNCPPQKLDAPLSAPLRHYWIEGNLTGTCSKCPENLSKMTILFGFRCSYCTVKVCPKCLPAAVNESCDEGPMAKLKLGPGDIVTCASDIPQHWQITIPKGRRPLMVFINRKSGGQVGKLIAQRLSRVVNPTQIVDLSQGGPMPMLKILQKTNSPYRVLACGGDGTAAWLLSALDKLAEEGATYLPPVAVLPLGTGNDLARVLGWGGGYDNEAMPPICADIEAGHEVHLDRWKLSIENIGVADGVKHPKVMNNYFSIGVDAKIALDFHRKREANPAQFSSRGMNKVIYAAIGTSAIINGCPNLSRILQLEMDGQVITLPDSLQGIMVLNLASWAGGQNPWGWKTDAKFGPQSPCDGMVEVLGVQSSFHLAQIQGHLTDGIRLGQGRSVKFTWITQDVLPVQLDGEPWEEGQSVIELTFYKQSRLIAAPREHQFWQKTQWLDPEMEIAGAEKKADEPEDGLVEIELAEGESPSPPRKHRKKSKSKKHENNISADATSSSTPEPLVKIDEDSKLVDDGSIVAVPASSLSADAPLSPSTEKPHPTETPATSPGGPSTPVIPEDEDDMKSKPRRGSVSSEPEKPDVSLLDLNEIKPHHSQNAPLSAQSDSRPLLEQSH